MPILMKYSKNGTNMKYLKLFENTKIDNINILECFRDLEDINIYPKFNIGYNSIILARHKRFRYEDIEETLLFAVPYLEDSGIKFIGGTVDYDSKFFKKNKMCMKKFRMNNIKDILKKCEDRIFIVCLHIQR